MPINYFLFILWTGSFTIIKLKANSQIFLRSKGGALASILAGYLTGCGGAPDKGQPLISERDDVPKIWSDQRVTGFSNSALGGPRLTMIGIKSLGKGCPEGTVASQIAADGQAFTLLFSGFQITFAPSENLYQRATRCTVDLKTFAPAGWQFSFVSLDLRGWADIGPQNRAEIHTKIAFRGGSSRQRYVAKLAGPYADNYQFRATFPVKRDQALSLLQHRWSACQPDQDLRIETSLQLKPAKGEAGQTPMTLTVDSTDGSFQHQWGLRWRRCRT